MTETPRKNVSAQSLIRPSINPEKYMVTGDLVDPTEYSSLRGFKESCGCFRCSMLDDSGGTWKSVEDLNHHIGLQDSMNKAYHAKTPHSAFYCELHTQKRLLTEQ